MLGHTRQHGLLPADESLPGSGCSSIALEAEAKLILTSHMQSQYGTLGTAYHVRRLCPAAVAPGDGNAPPQPSHHLHRGLPQPPSCRAASPARAADARRTAGSADARRAIPLIVRWAGRPQSPPLLRSQLTCLPRQVWSWLSEPVTSRSGPAGLRGSSRGCSS